MKGEDMVRSSTPFDPEELAEASRRLLSAVPLSFCGTCRYARDRLGGFAEKCGHPVNRKWVRNAMGECYKRLYCDDVNAKNNCSLWEPRLLERLRKWVEAWVK